MSTETTTTIPGAPIPAPPAHWRARRVPDAQHPERGQSKWNLNLDPADARRVGAQIQSADRRAERDGIQRSSRDARILRILDAANALAAMSAEGSDDETSRDAFELVHVLREFAARFVTVPAASDIRHEVPGVAA